MSRFHWEWRSGTLCNDSGVPLVRNLNLVQSERELMAAAPEMLVLLRELFGDGRGDDMTAATKRARELLKRLEGV